MGLSRIERAVYARRRRQWQAFVDEQVAESQAKLSRSARDVAKAMTWPDQHRWRVARGSGRVIYAMPDGHPTDKDQFIGCMDSRRLAQRVVDDHNGLLDVKPRSL